MFIGNFLYHERWASSHHGAHHIRTAEQAAARAVARNPEGAATRAARHAAARTAAQHRGRRRTRDTGHAVASRAARNTKDAAARRPQGTPPPAKQQETQTLSHRHGAIMSAGQYGEYPHCSLHAAHSLEIFGNVFTDHGSSKPDHPGGGGDPSLYREVMRRTSPSFKVCQ